MASDSPEANTFTDAPELLTRVEQREFGKLLGRGAAPAAACERLGLSMDAVWLTCEQDERFRTRLEKIQLMLNQNVEAALYRSAMQGKTTAQTFWFRREETKGKGSAPSLQDLSPEELRANAIRETNLLKQRLNKSEETSPKHP